MCEPEDGRGVCALRGTWDVRRVLAAVLGVDDNEAGICSLCAAWSTSGREMREPVLCGSATPVLSPCLRA